MKIMETWHQYCALRKTQDETYCDVAMTTILAPVFFCSEPKITICDSINERKKDLFTTQNERGFCKKETPFFFTLKGLSNKLNLDFTSSPL